MNLNMNETPVKFNIVQAKIRSFRWEVKYKRAADIFETRRSPKEEEKSWPKKIRRLHGTIRCNHAKELKSY